MKSAPEILSFCVASGVKLWADDGRLRFEGAESIVAPILPDLQRFKPALLELLAADVSVAPAPEAPATAPQFRRVNEFVLVPANPKPDIERQRVFEIALAREILESAYLDQTVCAWKICWAKGRHAWQRLCLDLGGTLDPDNNVPSLSAAAAIEWAKSRSESRNSATIQNEVNQ
jgi:hypothetical protein